ncbi:hypothetical protein PGT21_008828 [Puccinia graminis f. sp. tritici]|uniref:Uncharacterized protein n=1 Tax=Puccinia graminis f. sp. tritici TaxID=56615 RepID=A0A5B0LMZ8_PUCGR|nr:hypothetical protein PGT21_008828 [Puccinia graminis f. sp. tritici]KAA1136886.1 hypothetical protein PGTUg99_006831 [Puccinia graminis f. sp. tritici]
MRQEAEQVHEEVLPAFATGFDRDPVNSHNPSSSESVTSGKITEAQSAAFLEQEKNEQTGPPIAIKSQPTITQKQLEGSLEWKQRRQALEQEFETIREQLEMFKKKIGNVPWIKVYRHTDLRTAIRYIKEERRLMKNLRKLQAILELIRLCKRDRLFKLTDKRIVLAPLENVDLSTPKTSMRSVRQLASKAISTRRKLAKSYKAQGKSSTIPVRNINAQQKPLSQNSGTEVSLMGSSLEAGKLTGNALDAVMDRVTWGWIERLNKLVHDIMPIETAVEMIESQTNNGHLEGFKPFLLQQFVFRTIKFIYKNGMIPSNRLKDFLAFKDTERLALMNVYESTQTLPPIVIQYLEAVFGFDYPIFFLESVIESNHEFYRYLRQLP